MHIKHFSQLELPINLFELKNEVDTFTNALQMLPTFTELKLKYKTDDSTWIETTKSLNLITEKNQMASKRCSIIKDINDLKLRVIFLKQ